MTQASLLRHHIINSPQLPNLNTAEAATVCNQWRDCTFSDTAIYFYRCLIGSSITNIEIQSQTSPTMITSTKALMTVANISNLICR